MIPAHPLPLPQEWPDPDTYIDSLLEFATTSDLFRQLCGGVHILDFLTRQPDLYTSLLPQEWRDFFAEHEMGDILDLLLRDDIDGLRGATNGSASSEGSETEDNIWKGGPPPPQSLVEYIRNIRRFSLIRDFTRETPQGDRQKGTHTIPRHIAVGMKTKKFHEVENFSCYVDSLVSNVNGEPGDGEGVTHVVDFGSGQNYLGRTLASPPYNRQIIAIERKHQYISGARNMDVVARMGKKGKLGQGVVRPDNIRRQMARLTLETEPDKKESSEVESDSSLATPAVSDVSEEIPTAGMSTGAVHVASEIELGKSDCNGVTLASKESEDGNGIKGSIDYIEHEIQDGYLEPIIKHVVDPSPTGHSEKGEQQATSPRVMVVSLHSCGNLVHHGIRSLVLNPSVVAIAMIGCCYNLMTERLGPVTYKLPCLRSYNARLEAESNAYDPHGFPLSKRLENTTHATGNGVTLNITARSMAVQAPQNWTSEESEAFFTRHFFRALLQRILVDYGVVSRPDFSPGGDIGSASEHPLQRPMTPLIVGSLRKSAFVSFTAYARSAMNKLSRDNNYGNMIQEKVAGLPDEALERYVTDYASAKKNLSVVWSLMAFSAAVVESIIVVDRWLFLREQENVKAAWVEAVFEYSQSPRNLVVVGLKK